MKSWKPDCERYNNIENATLQTGEEGKNARRKVNACRPETAEKADRGVQAPEFPGEFSVPDHDSSGGPGGLPVQLSPDLRRADRVPGLHARGQDPVRHHDLGRL